MSEFDDAMRLTLLEPGRARCDFTPGWLIGRAVNGGVVMSLAATALREHLSGGRHPDPLVLSAYFLSATLPGPGLADTQVLRAGRTMTTAQVSVTQPREGSEGEVERLRAMATFGELDETASADRMPPMPPAPAPQECVDTRQARSDFRPPLMDRIDLRLDPACVGWAVGKPSRQGRMRGWLRFADGRPMDTISLLLALDALPPVTFDLGLRGWAPTLELTAHVRARPAPGWVFVDCRSETVAGGLFEEDARIWDSTGRLVAQSRQLAALPRPGWAPDSDDATATEPGESSPGPGE